MQSSLKERGDYTATVIGTAPLGGRCESLGENAMKMEYASKNDEQACITDKLRPLNAPTHAGIDCLIIKMPPPEVIAQWEVNDDPCELKRILRDLRWTGMISDALVVLAITGAIYFSPSLETLRATVERAAISVAEASRTR
jgi:hypothetical protein